MVAPRKTEGSRMERKKEETRLRILAAAKHLFQIQGIDATTMDQIALEADVARGTLYNYFPVKESIISGIVQQSFTDRHEGRVLELDSLPDTRARIAVLFQALIEGIVGQKDLFERFLVHRMKAVISFCPDESEYTGLHLLALRIVELGRESGELRTDLPAYVLHDLFNFVFIEAVKPLYLDPAAFDPQASIAYCTDLFMNGAARR